VAFVSDDPASPGPLLILDALLGGGSHASGDEYSFEIPDGREYSLGPAAALFVDGIALSTVAPVPLPAAGLLLLGAFGLLAGVRATRPA
jgi:hypothetical protein